MTENKIQIIPKPVRGLAILMMTVSSKWQNVHNISKMVHNSIKMVQTCGEMVHNTSKMVHNPEKTVRRQLGFLKKVIKMTENRIQIITISFSANKQKY